MKKTKPIVDPDEMFPKVEKMIYSQAWRFAKSYPISFDECKAEAYHAFVKACYDYQPEKMKFSSWCYYWVWCKLKDLIMKRTKDPHIFLDLSPSDAAEQRKAEELLGEAPQHTELFMQKVEETSSNLSHEAKRLLSLLIHTPEELLKGERPTPKQLLVRAKKHLVDNGVDKERVDTAHKELETNFVTRWKYTVT